MVKNFGGKELWRIKVNSPSFFANFLKAHEQKFGLVTMR